jgi:uncharacterized membrane protein YgaE (UPF0421/DUF939 family)
VAAKPQLLLAGARRRLHGRLMPIAQTAVAAVGAWLLAGLLVADSRPAFAAIAAVVCVGATFGQRGERALQLAGGVVIGITAAALLVGEIGTGAPQIGLLVVLAMLAAVLVGGGELLVSEAAVSAILLCTLGPGNDDGFSVNRIVEALIGGGTALAVGAVMFPPDPALAAGRAGQAVFAALGGTLERIADGLERRDPEAAQTALEDARAIDPLVAAVHESLAESRDVARIAPRRDARSQIARYDRSLAQLDFAVRNTRVLARHAVRLVRGGDVPAGVPGAVEELGEAIWELAAAYDDPRHARQARRLAVSAAAAATEVHGATPELTLTELVGQVRSTAVDVVRAAELVSDAPEPAAAEMPTEELLALPAGA